MNESISGDFRGTGRTGIKLGIGKENKGGACRAINLDHSLKGRN